MASLLVSRKRSDVAVRSEIFAKFVKAGKTKAEAERLMLLELLKREVRILIQKKIPIDRIHAAVDEITVEDVMES